MPGSRSASPGGGAGCAPGCAGRRVDEQLAVGEDVDLVWRLHGGGWRVRYKPAALVRHDHRVAVSQWARRKFDYGASAAPLALRHPGSVPPAVTSAVALAPLLFLRARRPWAARAAGFLPPSGWPTGCLPFRPRAGGRSAGRRWQRDHRAGSGQGSDAGLAAGDAGRGVAACPRAAAPSSPASSRCRCWAG